LNQDLIPADGIQRTLVTGEIEVHGGKHAKLNLSLNDVYQKNIASVRSNVRLSGSNRMAQDRLVQHVTTAIRRQDPNFHFVNLNNFAQSMRQPHLADTPVRILAAYGTDFTTPAERTIRLNVGAIFLKASDATTIQTAIGIVNAQRGAVVLTEQSKEGLRVKAMSGLGHVTVIVEGKTIQLPPGQELLVSDHQPSDAEIMPADGVGRRSLAKTKLNNNLHAVQSDFSLISLMRSAKYLEELRKHNSSEFDELTKQLLKTAASVELTTRERGRYYVQPKQTASTPGVQLGWAPGN
jgi:hypothetical protein